MNQRLDRIVGAHPREAGNLVRRTAESGAAQEMRGQARRPTDRHRVQRRSDIELPRRANVSRSHMTIERKARRNVMKDGLSRHGANRRAFVSLIESRLDRTSETFARNAERMRALSAELRERLLAARARRRERRYRQNIASETN